MVGPVLDVEVNSSEAEDRVHQAVSKFKSKPGCLVNFNLNQAAE